MPLIGAPLVLFTTLKMVNADALISGGKTPTAVSAENDTDGYKITTWAMFPLRIMLTLSGFVDNEFVYWLE